MKITWPGNVERDVKIASLEAQLIVEQSRRERAELELDRTRQDFNELVRITAGRVPDRTRSLGLDKDPFAEVIGEDTYLTPDPDETVISLPELERRLAEDESS